MAKVIWRTILGIASALACLSASGVNNPVRADDTIVIMAYGDSLTAGFMLRPQEAFPVQLEKALRERGHNVRVINAGVSGDTAAEGLARADWTLSEPADAVILELGANDALRGIDPAETEKALDALIAKFKERGMDVLIAGMEAPRNMGRDYAETFAALFPRLSLKYDTLLYPFFLEGVALRPELNMADGIHPTAEGVGVIVQSILPSVEALIERVKRRKGAS